MGSGGRRRRGEEGKVWRAFGCGKSPILLESNAGGSITTGGAGGTSPPKASPPDPSRDGKAAILLIAGLNEEDSRCVNILNSVHGPVLSASVTGRSKHEKKRFSLWENVFDAPACRWSPTCRVVNRLFLSLF